MAKKALILSVLFLATIPVGWYVSQITDVVFFDYGWGLLVAAAVLGALLGIYSGLTRPKERIFGSDVERHGARGFLSHWGTSVGIFVCVGTGVYMGFLWLAPFMGNIAQTVLAINLHFTGVALLLFGGFFFSFEYLFLGDFDRLIPNMKDLFCGMIAKYFLRRKWHAETKYLSSQKVAFIGMALAGAIILITGAFKVGARIWDVSADVYGWMTLFHDIGTAFFLFMLTIHILLVLVLRDHWPSLKSWITGTVPREYVEEHHPIWYEEMTTGQERSYKPFGYKEDKC